MRSNSIAKKIYTKNNHQAKIYFEKYYRKKYQGPGSQRESADPGQ